MKSNRNNDQQKRHHYVRTLLASLLGSLAIWLIILSVMVVWLNRTLTDTNTFVETVTPLASQPAVKDFISEQISSGVDNAGLQAEVATALLTPEEIAGKNPDQVQAKVKSVILNDVNKVLESKEFNNLWSTSIRGTHVQLVQQLEADSPTITLGFTPALTGATELLRTTRVAPIVDQLKVAPDQSIIELKGNNISTVHNLYENLKSATVLFIIFAIGLLVLAVTISVHHTKTLRRIGLATGIGLLWIGLTILLLPIIKVGGQDPASQELVSEIAQVILRSLKLTALASGSFLVVAVLISKYGPKIFKKFSKN